MKTFEINEHSEERYMHGWINRCIRLYFYFKEGLAQFGAMRTIGYTLIGIAGVFAIKDSSIRSYFYLGLIGVALVPILSLWGYIWIVRAKKSEEYYQIRYTTAYGRYQIQMQERIIELLEEIRNDANKNRTT